MGAGITTKMKRRDFLGGALKLSAAGVLAPAWLLDPPKGRSMVSVPEIWRKPISWTQSGLTPGEYNLSYYLKRGSEEWRRIEKISIGDAGTITVDFLDGDKVGSMCLIRPGYEPSIRWRYISNHNELRILGIM